MVQPLGFLDRIYLLLTFPLFLMTNKTELSIKAMDTLIGGIESVSVFLAVI